jgi:hypothetical protein
MKKLLATITVFCYLVMSSGIVVNFHYCMNRLASAQLFGTSAKVCGECGMDMHQNSDCCHDEMQVYKLDTDHNKAQVSLTIDPPEPEIAELSPFFETSFESTIEEKHFLNHSPPLLSLQDTYLQNCIFRL